jgi:hypothetical protein
MPHWDNRSWKIYDSVIPRILGMGDIEIVTLSNCHDTGTWIPGRVGFLEWKGHVWEYSESGGRTILRRQEDRYVLLISPSKFPDIHWLIHELVHVSLWTGNMRPDSTSPYLTELETVVLHWAWLNDLAPGLQTGFLRESEKFEAFIPFVELIVPESPFRDVVEASLGLTRTNSWAWEIEKLQFIGCLGMDEKPSYLFADWDHIQNFELTCEGALRRVRAARRERDSRRADQESAQSNSDGSSDGPG